MRRCLLLLVLAFFLGAPQGAGAQQVKLRVTLQVAASEPYLGVPLARFKEEVEKRSGKAISIEIFDKGQLYIDTQVVEAVASGAIEMGGAGTYQFAKKIPDISIVEQPFLLNFEALLRAAVAPESQIRKLIDQTVLEATGVRVLWWQAAGSSVFFTKGKDATDPQVIKGKRVRVFSQITAQMTKACGGTPTVISTSKMHEAMKDGAVDLAMGSITSVEPRELWKVADIVTMTHHVPIEFMLLINERTWQSLSSQHRTIIAETARDVERATRDRVSEMEAGAYAFAKAKGMQVRSLTPDQVAEWRACSADVLVDYMGQEGELVRQLLAAYGRLRTLPCCTAGPESATPFNRR
jgi:C4-dicarboxylate-binding protein DctP